MSETKFLKCSCSECGGHIEYPADAAGQTIECPHCREQTDLWIDDPEELTAPEPRRGWLLWALIGLLALGAAGAAAPWLLKRAARNARQKPAATASDLPGPAGKPAMSNFELDRVGFERPGGNSLIYATGALHNMLAKQRFAVRADLELLDASGKTVGNASDYTAVIEPKAAWHFKALVIQTNATAARIVRIREQ